MLCCENSKDTTTIGSNPHTLMYRNLPTDASQVSTDSNFFQPSYNPRMIQTQAYASSGYGTVQPTFSSAEQLHSSSGLAHDYSSQFFVSDLNSHFHGDGNTSHCTWGPGTFYPSDSLPPGLNPCNSWETPSQSLHGHGHQVTIGGATGFPSSVGSGHGQLIDPTDQSGLPPVTLTAIDCFSNPVDSSGAIGLQLPPIPHRTLPSQRRPYEWINKNAYQNPQTQQGKTRTKDKYRVVYSDHQRLELEKEFRFSRYITIRRKAELASQLCLSERQVKIWFQNRRAKERKASKKNTNLGSPSGEDQEGLEEGEASDNSALGGESPGIHSHSGVQMSPTQQRSMAIAYNQTNAASGESSSIAFPDEGASALTSISSSQLPYSYSIGSPRQHGNYEQLPTDIDIKPLLTGSSQARRVASSIDDIDASKAAVTTSIESELNNL